MAMYEALASMNVIRPIVRKFQQGIYKLVPDDDFGGYRIAIRQSPNVFLPWVLTVRSQDRMCDFWYDVLFEDYGLLPSGCGGCWKIAMKLETLDQLFGVLNLQRRMGKPSKCGMDERPWVDALYTAYWYCPYKEGLEGARALHQKVSRAVHREVDPKIKVLLKRA